MKKNLIAALLVVTLIGNASAGALDKSINDMFTNITTPGSISDNMRGAMYGGSAYIRTPNMMVNPIQIDLPRFSAGCGGIDATFGAFSWISADKLMQFARKIIQQAVPVAFDMALNAFSPTLHEILTKFQKLAQDMNNFNMNSCQLATGIVGSLVDPAAAAENVGKAAGSIYSAATGISEDFSKAVANFTINPSEIFNRMQQYAQKGASSGARKMESPSFGNLTWNALNTKQDMVGFDFYIDSDPMLSKQIIMSIVGTTVMAPSTQGDDTSPVVPVFYDPILKYHEIVEDRAKLENKKIKVYACDDNTKCDSMQQTDVDYIGVKGYVMKMMFGSATAKTPETGSIVDIMGSNCSPQGGTAMSCFSQEQKNFLASVAGTPILAILKRSQFNRDLLTESARELIDVIVADVAASYGARLGKIMRSIYAGTRNPKSEKFDQALSELEREVAEYAKTAREGNKKKKEINDSIDQLIKSNPELGPWKHRKTMGN